MSTLQYLMVVALNFAERHGDAIPSPCGHGDVRTIADLQRRVRRSHQQDLRLAEAGHETRIPGTRRHQA